MYTMISTAGDQSQYNSSIYKKEKENVPLIPRPSGHNNYAEVYIQSSWEDVAQQVTVSSVKSTDETCKIHSG